MSAKGIGDGMKSCNKRYEMTNMEKWNRLVDTYNRLTGRLENVVQFIWETDVCQDYLGFPPAEVNSQRVVQMGVAPKRADIVLNKDGNEECVIELKRTELTIGQSQLFSYLIQIRTISIGVLAGDKLHIYYYDYMSPDPVENSPCIEIPFERDNPDGEKFIELFNYASFDRNEIRQWILERDEQVRNERMQRENARQNIEQIIDAMNETLVTDLLKRHFVNEGFPEDDVNSALETRLISVEARPLAVGGEIVAPANFNGNTELHYYVGGIEASARTFEVKLIERKIARRKYYYGNGTEQTDNWNAARFNGNLSAQIHSATYWRRRNATGLIRVDFYID